MKTDVMGAQTMTPLQIPLRYFKELQQKQQILFLAKVTVLARHQVL